MAASTEPKFVGLPLSVAQPVDIGRILREVTEIDETLRQEAIRSPKAKEASLELSKNLSQLMDLNSVDILKTRDRQDLINFLEAVKARAPVMHISFASEPSTSFLDKLMTYLRREINPLALLMVGLEPNIGAGCTLRTNSKYFDLSLKEKLKQSRGLLIQKIKEEPVVAK